MYFANFANVNSWNCDRKTSIGHFAQRVRRTKAEQCWTKFVLKNEQDIWQCQKKVVLLQIESQIFDESLGGTSNYSYFESDTSKDSEELSNDIKSYDDYDEFYQEANC